MIEKGAAYGGFKCSIGPREPSRKEKRLKADPGSRVFVRCIIEGEVDAIRLERVRRAFEAKCPKLAAWFRDDRASVLILEANDIQLSNVFLVLEAVKQVIAERTDIPNVIIFAETDAGPMFGWVFKDGPDIGDAVPMPNGTRCYIEGQLGPISIRP